MLAKIEHQPYTEMIMKTYEKCSTKNFIDLDNIDYKFMIIIKVNGREMIYMYTIHVDEASLRFVIHRSKWKRNDLSIMIFKIVMHFKRIKKQSLD
jgi:hypothetical protein